MNALCHKYLNQNILPMAGREEDLAILKAQFEQFVRNGETTFSLIAGSIGIGKSRLVKEFEESIQKEFAEGLILIHARYLEGNVAAITPLLNAFHAALAHNPALHAVLDQVGLKKRVQNIQAEGPALQTLLDSFQEIARRFPLVLILEDLHNLDDLSALDQLFLGLSSVSTHVIFSYRLSEGISRGDRGVEHFVRELSLREECPLRIISLDNLASPDISRLLTELFEIQPSNTFVDKIGQLTNGRPLALRSMLRSLISQGALSYNHGVWYESESTAPMEVDELQESEQGLISRFEQELERLGPDEQVVAMHAAWLGEQFDIRLLKELLQYNNHTEALESFDRAIQLLTFKSIVRPAVPSILFTVASGAAATKEGEAAGSYCYEFSHPHFFNTILSASRAQVTGRHDIVLAIASMAAKDHLPLFSSTFLSLSGNPFVIARTSEAKTTVERFLQWAAEVARSLWFVEPQQTLRFLVAVRPVRDDITWRFGPELSEEAMQALLELHSMIVEAMLRAASIIEAERDLEHAAVLEKFITSRATNQEFSTSFQAHARGKVSCLRAVLALAKGNNADFERWAQLAYVSLMRMNEEDLERSRLLCMLARAKAEMLLVAGQLQEADRLLEDNLAIARSLVDARSDEYSSFYRLAVNSKLKQGKNAEASLLIQQIVEQARERRDAITETMFLYQACVAAFSTGDVTEATRFVEQGIIYGKRYGIRFAEVMSNIWRMILAGVQLDPDKVKECTANLDSILAQSSNLLWRISYIEGRSTTMNFLQRHQPALEFAEEAIRLADSNEYHSFAAWAHNEKGLALIGLGRYREAEETAQKCLALSGQQIMAERMARTVLISAYTGLNRWKEAEEELERTRQLFDEKNPYYFRFLQAESAYLRARIQRTTTRTERGVLTERLTACAQALVDLSRQWKAERVEQSLIDEFKDIVSLKMPANVPEAVGSGHQVAEVAARFHLRTMGPFEVQDLLAHASEAPKRGRDSKVKQLISMLLTSRIENRELTKDQLADRLWPDSDGAAATAALHTTVKRARALLGDASTILFTDGNYQLGPVVRSDAELVLKEAEEVRQLARKGATFSVAFRYDQLLKSLKRGQYFEGVDGSWLDGVRSRLDGLRFTVTERLLEIDIERGLLDKAESLCYEIFREDEFDERALRSLITIAAKRKHAAKIPTIFETYASRYRKEFRSEPDPALRRYVDQMLESAKA